MGSFEQHHDPYTEELLAGKKPEKHPEIWGAPELPKGFTGKIMEEMCVAFLGTKKKLAETLGALQKKKPQEVVGEQAGSGSLAAGVEQILGEISQSMEKQQVEKVTEEQGTPQEQKMLYEEFIEAYPTTVQLMDDLELAEDVSEAEQILNEATAEELVAGTEYLEMKAEALTAASLKKISEQLGSNEGGWYKQESTGEQYYVKFYQKPDQARAEFIANEVYKTLNIPAAESQLFEMDGRLAIASKIIPGLERNKRGAGGRSTKSEKKPAPSATLEEQKASKDVRNGFVADAYLANWDVVGLAFDNIVRGKDGRLYRVDNGGSLRFRAQGAEKDFEAGNVPELETMQHPGYTAGKVFGGIPPEEQKEQASKLVAKLTDKEIERIVSAAGGDKEFSDVTAQTLKGRCEFLREHFQLQSAERKRRTHGQERVAQTIRRLQFERREGRGTEFRRRTHLLADKEKIENQEVHIIDESDRGQYVVQCKLTEKQERGIWERVKSNPVDTVEMQSLSGTSIPWSNAYAIPYKGAMVKIAMGKVQTDYGFQEVRTAQGLVQIEIPVPEEENDLTHEQIGETVDGVFKEILDIEEGLEPPEEEAERAYKRARYLWHHKLNPGDITEEEWRIIEQNLTREEVFDAYSTFVEKGKHKEYLEEFGPYAVYHSIRNPANLPAIIKNGGLMCTTERYRRGAFIEGMSSDMDIQEGGGDSVFTRILTWEEARNWDERRIARMFRDGPTILMKNSVLDRTDWYTYQTDQYGRTNMLYLRHAPRNIFRQLGVLDFRANEQMFRLGISTTQMERIVCGNEEEREQIVGILKDEGISEVNGVPVEEFVVTGSNIKELLEWNGSMKYENRIEERREKLTPLEWDDDQKQFVESQKPEDVSLY